MTCRQSWQGGLCSIQTNLAALQSSAHYTGRQHALSYSLRREQGLVSTWGCILDPLCACWSWLLSFSLLIGQGLGCRAFGWVRSTPPDQTAVGAAWCSANSIKASRQQLKLNPKPLLFVRNLKPLKSKFLIPNPQVSSKLVVISPFFGCLAANSPVFWLQILPSGLQVLLQLQKVCSGCNETHVAVISLIIPRLGARGGGGGEFRRLPWWTRIGAGIDVIFAAVFLWHLGL